MAARLSLDERVFIESSLGAGRSVADVRSGWAVIGPRCIASWPAAAGRAGYDARWAHALREGATRANAQAGGSGAGRRGR